MISHNNNQKCNIDILKESITNKKRTDTKYTYEETKGAAIKKEQSRDTGNIGNTRLIKKINKKMHNTENQKDYQSMN